jgi:hypothetical protein
VWINLDYLSAEAWVPGCHALPSPHPHLPLVKYFFFPGFATDTGGLLRERDLRLAAAAFRRQRRSAAATGGASFGSAAPPPRRHAAGLAVRL